MKLSIALLDAEYLSILDEMKVSKKVRLTELENEKARLRDEMCHVKLAQEAIRKEAAKDSDSSSSVPKRKKNEENYRAAGSKS